jgi:hypothetical protein
MVVIVFNIVTRKAKSHQGVKIATQMLRLSSNAAGHAEPSSKEFDE